MKRAIAALVLSAAVGGCSLGTGPAATPGATVAPSPTPTSSPSPAPPTVPPTEPPDLEASPALYVAWDTGFATTNASFYAIAQVVVPVRNNGADWVHIRPSASRYTITASDGTVMATAEFDAVYPNDLAPGKVGYLASEAILPNMKAASIGTVTAEVASERIVKTAAVVVTVAKVKTTYSTYYRAVVTSGSATNHSTKRINGFDVVALYFSAGGAFLGFGSLNPGILRAGATTAFTTIPVGHGLKLSEIATTTAVPGCYCPDQ